MGSTAVQIVNAALRQCNLDEVASFSTSQEFPKNIALDVLNTVIREMNRWGSYWFQETETNLTYAVSTYTYSLTTLGIDPKRIVSIRKTLTNYYGFLSQYNNPHFIKQFRFADIQTAEPVAFTKYGDTLELNCIPDKDYSLKVKHFKDIPMVSATTTTFNIPEADEDVFIEGCIAYFQKAIGKGDYSVAYQLFEKKAKNLLADLKEDAGLPAQMPASF
jgi:hypothetical protein